MAKLQPFMTEDEINAAPPRAPEFVMWAPPHGAAVECPNLITAQRAAERFAGKHPGTTVAVYQLVGSAYKPIEEPEFTPHGPGAEAEVIVGKAEELAVGHHDTGANPQGRSLSDDGAAPGEERPDRGRTRRADRGQPRREQKDQRQADASDAEGNQAAAGEGKASRKSTASPGALACSAAIATGDRRRRARASTSIASRCCNACSTTIGDIGESG